MYPLNGCHSLSRCMASITAFGKCSLSGDQKQDVNEALSRYVHTSIGNRVVSQKRLPVPYRYLEMDVSHCNWRDHMCKVGFNWIPHKSLMSVGLTAGTPEYPENVDPV